MMNDESLSNTDDNSIEIKKELCIYTRKENFNKIKDSSILSESIFDTIPFMAKLLESLRCSFFNEGNEIFIANIELATLRQLFDRLDNFAISANRMECLQDGTFSLAIDLAQIADRTEYRVHLTSMQLLPWVAAALCAQDVVLQIFPNDIQVNLLTVPSLARLMQRLKQVSVRPSKIKSFKNSIFSLVFTLKSLPRECNIKNQKTRTVSNYSREYSVENQELTNPPKTALFRSRACPNYLRDYVVEDDQPVTKQPKLQNLENFTTLLPNTMNNGIISNYPTENYGNICKPRGRPRIRPLVVDTYPKRPRGRPRRSDSIPCENSSNNSFMNIQSGGFNPDEFKNYFERYLDKESGRKSLQ